MHGLNPTIDDLHRLLHLLFLPNLYPPLVRLLHPLLPLHRQPPSRPLPNPNPVLRPPLPNPSPHPLLPSHPHTLVLTLDNLSSFLLFTTSPSASALQWLSPSQTKSKTHPFVYTQCHSIHARSIFPCQDTPAARVRYFFAAQHPLALSAVMLATKVRRWEPADGKCRNAVGHEVWCGPGRIVEEFVMEQPIPTYLFTCAVREIGEREVGPRTRVYAEGGKEVLAVAEREFKGTE